MSAETAALLSPVFAFIANILVQLISSRLTKGGGFVKSLLIGFGAGFLALLITELRLAENYGLDAYIIAANLITYAALSYGYFHFLNLGETARRVRLLTELREHPEGLSEEGILALYNAKEIIEKRIGRLIENKQIRFENGQYRISNPHVLWASRITEGLRLVLFGRRRGQ